jgi:hypothetical protein
LFKGEQQKNVDFSFLQALQTTAVDPQQGVMIIYDIACQYSIHLQERIGHHLPAGLKVDHAIGLFHVHGHKDECFFRFATSFIPGLGIVAGEILESLWSSLNAISPTVRTATLAHRAEMLDDHASDSNHRKALGMADSLCKRHLEASTLVRQTQTYYTEVTAAVGQQTSEAWEREILAAEHTRQENVKAMDIYAARVPGQAPAVGLAPAVRPGPAPAKSTAAEDWIQFALMIEERQ